MTSIVVVLPTITVDEQLDTAVNSILSGTLTRLRLLVVHDGVVPDSTRPWMSDPRVDVLHFASRGGLVAGLWEAISRSNEDLVARLDADDYSSPTRLEQQVRYLSDHPDAALVASEAMRIDSNDARLGVMVRVSGDDVRRELLQRNVIVHSSVVFRRSAYERAGGFDRSLPQMEDYELWLRMGRLGPIAIVRDTLVFYRIHPGQISRVAKPYGAHVRAVNRARRRLAKYLHVGPAESYVRELTWTVAQYARYFKIRRPGYDQNQVGDDA